MYLGKKDHVARHAPYKKILRDEHDNPVGLLPQAFEMREIDNGALSVNWLEFFDETHENNIIKMIKDFRRFRKMKGFPVGLKSAFGIGNVERLQDVCAEKQHPKVRVEYEEKKSKKHNASHARIIRLPLNDSVIMESLASNVFVKLVLNKNI
jgi:hypothetical protein